MCQGQRPQPGCRFRDGCACCGQAPWHKEGPHHFIHLFSVVFFFNFWSKISALLIVAKMVCFPGFPWGWWWGLAQNVGCQVVPPRAAPRHSQTLLPDPANRICFFVHCCTLCARLSTVLWHDNLNTERPKMFAQTQISPSKCSSSALLTRVPKKKLPETVAGGHRCSPSVQHLGEHRFFSGTAIVFPKKLCPGGGPETDTEANLLP